MAGTCPQTRRNKHAHDPSQADGTRLLPLVQASYSGNAANRQSLYNLAPIDDPPVCESVTFPKFPSLEGVDGQGQDPSIGFSTNCPGILECGTTYLLRGFAHAVPGTDLKRSNFTQVQPFTTHGELEKALG